MADSSAIKSPHHTPSSRSAWLDEFGFVSISVETDADTRSPASQGYESDGVIAYMHTCMCSHPISHPNILLYLAVRLACVGVYGFVRNFIAISDGSVGLAGNNRLWMLFLEGCVRRGLGIKEHLKLWFELKAVRLADCVEVERRGVRKRS